MPYDLELDPVDIITVDAIGEPGQRIFYLQGRKGNEVITLLAEKLQIQTLAVGVEQFLSEVNGRHPNLPAASGDYDEDQMHILPPYEPLFQIAELGLSYDSDHDMVALIARGMPPEDFEGELPIEGEPEHDNDAPVDEAHFWCTRSQIRAMGHWGIELANRGRPICPQCGEPMEPEGHFCPKKNGHKKK